MLNMARTLVAAVLCSGAAAAIALLSRGVSIRTMKLLLLLTYSPQDCATIVIEVLSNFTVAAFFKAGMGE